MNDLGRRDRYGEPLDQDDDCSCDHGWLPPDDDGRPRPCPHHRPLPRRPAGTEGIPMPERFRAVVELYRTQARERREREDTDA